MSKPLPPRPRPPKWPGHNATDEEREVYYHARHDYRRRLREWNETKRALSPSLIDVWVKSRDASGTSALSLPARSSVTVGLRSRNGVAGHGYIRVIAKRRKDGNVDLLVTINDRKLHRWITVYDGLANGTDIAEASARCAGRIINSALKVGG